MDTSGFDQVGRYGTLSLLKAGNVSSEESSVVTSFGVDTAPLTFGSATTCDVRLYYPDVEKVHCKIVFNEEHKAFLTILGVSGVHIDGCQVYPHTSSVNNSRTGVQNTPQTTIPLTNHSVFQIHGKRFQFSYPPKDSRKAIFDTPPQQKRRALRLSMIHSAEVFSPRPSKDPRENLRILQSPLKSAFMKSPSKLRPQSPGSRLPAPQFVDEEEEEEIVLVETNYPRVVEEEKDLIILEDAPLPIPRTQSPVQPPVTPRRRSLASNALHRAVLIRSAQRAVVRAERVREEEEDLEEEAEVFGTVLEEDEDVIGDDEGLEDDHEIHDVHMRSPGEVDDERSEDESTDDEEEDDRQPPTEQQKSLWRKSLERMWPFRSTSPERPPDGNANQRTDAHEDKADRDDEDSGSDSDDTGTDDAVASLPNRNISSTPIRRALGSFMTPQHQPAQSQTQRIFPEAGSSHAGAGASNGRFSLGGGEARRVVVQRPWKVKDLVVPSAPPAVLAPASPMRPPPPPARVQNTPVNATPKLSLEEKKAIQERRRSAVRQPDNFFAGGIPGMSPNKASSSTPSAPGANSWRATASPVKLNFGSPTKGRPLEAAISEQEETQSPHPSGDSDEDPLDTQVLMERMKSTVEDLKRRRSMAPGGSTPQFPPPSLHPKTEIRPEATTRVNLAPRLSVGVGVPSLGPIKKLDFSTVSTTPARKTYEASHITPKPLESTKRAAPPATMDADDNSDSDGVESPKQTELPAFSLLRPAAREEAESRRSSGGGQISPVKVHHEEAEDEEMPSAKTVPLPELAIEDEVDVHMESEEVPEPVVKASSPKKTRSRLLRPTKEKEPINTPSEVVEEPIQPVRKPPSRSRSKPPSTNLAVPAARTRSKSPRPPQEEESSEEHVQPAPTRAKPPSKSKTPATTRRVRKVAATPDPEAMQNEDELQTPMTTAGKRGRKAHIETPETVEEQPEADPEVEEEVEPEAIPEPAAPKRGRPKKPVSTEAKSKIPAAKPAAKSRSRVRQVQEEPEEDDPLDSYDVNGDVEESEAPIPTPAARSRATKIPSSSKARTTKKVIKQEEEAQPEPAALAPAKTSRSTRVNTAATPAVAATATKGRKLRTPATAPAASVVDKGKENMSGSGSGSDMVVDTEEGLAKVRVSRTRGTTKKVAAKAEEVAAEIPDAPVKPTRAKAAGTSRTARTRTKTG